MSYLRVGAEKDIVSRRTDLHNLSVEPKRPATDSRKVLAVRNHQIGHTSIVFHTFLVIFHHLINSVVLDFLQLQVAVPSLNIILSLAFLYILVEPHIVDPNLCSRKVIKVCDSTDFHLSYFVWYIGISLRYQPTNIHFGSG